MKKKQRYKVIKIKFRIAHFTVCGNALLLTFCAGVDIGRKSQNIIRATIYDGANFLD